MISSEKFCKILRYGTISMEFERVDGDARTFRFPPGRFGDDSMNRLPGVIRENFASTSTTLSSFSSVRAVPAGSSFSATTVPRT